MAIKTTISQIEEVQAAITKVMSAQDSSFADKRIMRAKLDALTAREEYLLKRYRAEQGGGGLYVNVGIPKRSY